MQSRIESSQLKRYRCRDCCPGNNTERRKCDYCATLENLRHGTYMNAKESIFLPGDRSILPFLAKYIQKSVRDGDWDGSSTPGHLRGPELKLLLSIVVEWDYHINRDKIPLGVQCHYPRGKLDCQDAVSGVFQDALDAALQLIHHTLHATASAWIETYKSARDAMVPPALAADDLIAECGQLRQQISALTPLPAKLSALELENKALRVKVNDSEAEIYDLMDEKDRLLEELDEIDPLKRANKELSEKYCELTAKHTELCTRADQREVVVEALLDQALIDAKKLDASFSDMKAKCEQQQLIINELEAKSERQEVAYNEMLASHNALLALYEEVRARNGMPSTAQEQRELLNSQDACTAIMAVLRMLQRDKTL